jgi:hypothetical protein
MTPAEVRAECDAIRDETGWEAWRGENLLWHARPGSHLLVPAGLRVHGDSPRELRQEISDAEWMAGRR